MSRTTDLLWLRRAGKALAGRVVEVAPPGLLAMVSSTDAGDELVVLDVSGGAEASTLRVLHGRLI